MRKKNFQLKMNLKNILGNLKSSGSLDELSSLLKDDKLEANTKFKGKILNSKNFENKIT